VRHGGAACAGRKGALVGFFASQIGELAMAYLAVDLHRRRSHVVAVDAGGRQLLSRRLDNSEQEFMGLLATLEERPLVVVEATYGWEWLVELLQREGCEVRLAHPLRTRAIATARIKTDAVDAATLAELLRAGLLPEAFIAPQELRDVRDLVRQRIDLVRVRTSLKNRVHALLARDGVSYSRSTLFGRSGRAFLESLPLRAAPRRRVDALLRLIDAVDGELNALRAEIDSLASEEPGVETLTQIPGIWNYLALLVIATVGDVQRFPSARHLCSWAGLAPKVRSSDGKFHLGHITRQGSPELRSGLCLAAQTARRREGPLQDLYDRTAGRRGKQIATVALARRLLTLSYYGLRDGEIRCLSDPAANRGGRPAGDEQCHAS
jgi:transposase